MTLISASIPFGPINNISQTFAHPQAIARESTVEIDVRVSPVLQRACRVKLFLASPRRQSSYGCVTGYLQRQKDASEATTALAFTTYHGGMPATFMSHSHLASNVRLQILQELGYSINEIARLRASKVV